MACLELARPRRSRKGRTELTWFLRMVTEALWIGAPYDCEFFTFSLLLIIRDLG